MNVRERIASLRRRRGNRFEHEVDLGRITYSRLIDVIDWVIDKNLTGYDIRHEMMDLFFAPSSAEALSGEALHLMRASVFNTRDVSRTLANAMGHSPLDEPTTAGRFFFEDSTMAVEFKLAFSQ